MADNPFSSAIPKPRSGPDPSGEAIAVLDQLVEALNVALAPGGRVQRQPWVNTNLGVQHRLVVTIESRNFTDALLEAYVPLGGGPVTLNSYGAQPWRTADSPEQLQLMLNDLLTNSPLHDRLQQLVNLAAAGAG